MRAVRLYGVGDLRFELTGALRDLPKDCARVRVHTAGVCGSDLHNFRTGQWWKGVPTIPGHEFAGEIIAVGSDVVDFRPGDLIVGDSRVNCGECHLGFGPLAVVDRNDARARLIASITGAKIIQPLAAEVAEFAGAAGLHYAVEATGSPKILTFLLGALAGGGRLAMVGLFAGDPAVNANAIVERELDIRGCSVFCEEQLEVLPLLASLTSKLERVTAPSIPLEQLPLEYERLISGQSGFLKTIVRF